jgi:hypothetical protein
MNTSPATAETPAMPRRLAIDLLHLAQIHAERELAGLVSCRFHIPQQLFLLEGEGASVLSSADPPRSWAAVLEQIASRAERPWAVFVTFPGLPRLPREGPGAHASHLLHLTVSLSIRGVLQMAAWRYSAQGWQEQDLKMLEAEEL